jgi:hypothetical protein
MEQLLVAHAFTKVHKGHVHSLGSSAALRRPAAAASAVATTISADSRRFRRFSRADMSGVRGGSWDRGEGNGGAAGHWGRDVTHKAIRESRAGHGWGVRVT